MIYEGSKCPYLASQNGFSNILVWPQCILNWKFYSVFFLVGDIPFTNWGISNNVLEPSGDRKCIKTCVDASDPDCKGKWKVEDCSTSLKYICQTPCKILRLEL